MKELCATLGHEWKSRHSYDSKHIRVCGVCDSWSYEINGEWVSEEEYHTILLVEGRKRHISDMKELPLDATPPIEMTAAFTGHRPQKLGGFKEDNPINKSVIKSIEKAIYDAYDNGYRHFISGGALGVDQWAAKKVLDMKFQYGKTDVSLYIARPFYTQEKIWGYDAKMVYWSLLNHASGVYTISEGEYSPQKMYARNDWMVDNSGLLIAVYDGSLSGGTAQCVMYAKNAKKRIWQIKPPTKKKLSDVV